MAYIVLSLLLCFALGANADFFVFPTYANDTCTGAPTGALAYVIGTCGYKKGRYYYKYEYFPETGGMKELHCFDSGCIRCEAVESDSEAGTIQARTCFYSQGNWVSPIYSASLPNYFNNTAVTVGYKNLTGCNGPITWYKTELGSCGGNGSSCSVDGTMGSSQTLCYINSTAAISSANATIAGPTTAGGYMIETFYYDHQCRNFSHSQAVAINVCRPSQFGNSWYSKYVYYPAINTVYEHYCRNSACTSQCYSADSSEGNHEYPHSCFYYRHYYAVPSYYSSTLPASFSGNTLVTEHYVNASHCQSGSGPLAIISTSFQSCNNNTVLNTTCVADFTNSVGYNQPACYLAPASTTGSTSTGSSTTNTATIIANMNCYGTSGTVNTGGIAMALESQYDGSMVTATIASSKRTVETAATNFVINVNVFFADTSDLAYVVNGSAPLSTQVTYFGNLLAQFLNSSTITSQMGGATVVSVNVNGTYTTVAGTSTGGTGTGSGNGTTTATTTASSSSSAGSFVSSNVALLVTAFVSLVLVNLFSSRRV